MTCQFIRNILAVIFFSHLHNLQIVLTISQGRTVPPPPLPIPLFLLYLTDLPDRTGRRPGKGHMILQIGAGRPIQPDPIPGGQQPPITGLHLVHHHQVLGRVGRRRRTEADNRLVGGKE